MVFRSRSQKVVTHAQVEPSEISFRVSPIERARVPPGTGNATCYAERVQVHRAAEARSFALVRRRYVYRAANG
jgi:hypothetical protein